MRLRVPSPRLRRGLIAAVALLGQFTSAFGMPLPALKRKDTSRPFPCMSHSCGCINIEEFWQSCCCFTNAEKVAWAEANNVSTPDFVRVAAAREKPRKTKSCCCDKKGAACCEAATESCAKCSEEKPAKTTSSIRWVLGIAAKRCGGHGESGTLQAAPSIPAAATVSLTFDWNLVTSLPVLDWRPFTQLQTPPIPPPRAA